jgi:hypothetical protein
VVEELPQGREDPLVLSCTSGHAIGAAPMSELWPALVNSLHDSFLVGARSVSPLYAAVLCGCDGISRLASYVAAGSDVDLEAGDGTTALMGAFVTGQLGAAEFLLSRGASVNAHDGLGQPVSKYAACAVGRTPCWSSGGPLATDFSVRNDASTDRVVAMCLETLRGQGGFAFFVRCSPFSGH